jgi:uncharacterized protein (DUF697 family)
MPTEAQETKEMMVTEPSKEHVDKVIRHHVWGAIGVGLIPLPLVDYVALTGIQLDMLRQLAKTYNVPFFKDKVKNVLSPLVGAAVPGMLGAPLAISIAKVVPLLGQTAGVVTMPIVAGATTYAVGKVFVQHFASGGTFLTFNPEKVKAYYAEMFEEGKKVATAMSK